MAGPAIHHLDAERGARPWALRSEVLARHGMAATSQPLATQSAVDILRRGGSAIDAAVAANAVLGLVEPTGCGLGGDLFAIVWDAGTSTLQGLNGSGRAPRGINIDRIREAGHESIPAYGPLPVSVPGCVDAWCTLHRRFGQLPLGEVLAPAIAYAREGFPVSDIIARQWQANATVLKDFKGFADVFMPDGQAPIKGQCFRNPGLAHSLQAIADGGRDAFYTGELAQTIAGYLQAQGGFLDATDLSAHCSEWVDPVSTCYRGFDVWQLPPNGHGIAVLQLLNLLEGFDLAADGFGSVSNLHRMLESSKLVYADRACHYADPDYYELPLEWLISKQYAAQRRELIDMGGAATSSIAGLPPVAPDTVYLTVADRHGNIVSLIQSNYRGMGSGMTPPGLGFVLQDRGMSFSLDPAHANALQPGKRPFHTIIPGFVTRDAMPWFSFGVMGGAMQPMGQLQVLTNMIDYGMDAQQAGDAPRWRLDGTDEPTGERMVDGGVVQLESGFDATVREGLEALGHRIGNDRHGFGGYQGIRIDLPDRVYLGATESRKDGQAAGY